MPAAGPKATYLVGLTGGIGSGKSTVAGLFAELGAGIIDADAISRALLAKGTPQYVEVLARFGAAIRDAQGNLDRAKLRARIFSASADKQWLEALLHPAILSTIKERVRESDKPYLVLVVPLLVESGNYGFVDRVLVVDAPESVQVDRIRARDGSTETVIRGIIDAQASRETRLAAADDVIRNDGSIASLRSEVLRLHDNYMRAAGKT